MGWQERRREIKEELIGQTGKQALLVEGADDEFFFRIFLDRKFEKIWENTWVLAGAGNKKTVTEMLVQEPDWLGIVDRDEWREEVIDEKQAELNNLFVLPRFCIESYAIEPIELWQALPEKKRQKIAGGFEALESEILENKGQWLRHGVLWSVINPLWSGLRSLGFKEKLLDFTAAQNDDIIKNILQEWHSYLDPDAILKEFDEKLQNVQQLSQQEQFAKWLHGKQFFYEKIHPVLNKYLGQNDAKNRLKEIFRTRELPEDLKPLWARIHQ
jgi:hypothetical protein